MYLPKRNYVNSSWKITFLFWVDNNSIHKWKLIFISKLLQIIWVAKNKKIFLKSWIHIPKEKLSSEVIVF